GALILVHNRSANGSQLGFLPLGFILREQYDCREGNERDQSKRPARVHGFPPVPGPDCGSVCSSIRIVRSARFSCRASTFRDCVLKPRASIVNSYSAPGGTRNASSPWWSDIVSHRNFFSSERRTRARAPGRANPWPENTVAKMTKSWA